jgi:pimeloyl-ACP methyl ester carboxylesterase
VVAAIGDRASTIAYHRPGWDGRRAARGLEGNAEAAIEELDRREIERAVVVGHSFGGGVAAWLAVHHPERVVALVLVAPAASAKALDRGDRLLAAPVLGDVASAGSLAGVGVALSTPLARRLLASRFGLDENYLRAGGRVMVRPASWRSFVVEQRAMFDELPVLEPLLARIRVPTAVVTGTGDPIVPAAATKRLAEQIPDAKLSVIERAGHLLPHLHAEALAATILTLGS